MKKIIAFLVTVTLMLTFVSANAALPGYMTETYNNYTYDGTMTMEFTNPESLTEMFGLDMQESPVSGMYDIESIFSGLLSPDATIKMQSDISDDCKKIQLFTEIESLYNVAVSDHMTVDVKSTTRVWTNIDMSAQEPVFEVIYLYPYSNKYVRRNMFDEVSEEDMPLVLTLMNMICNKDFMETFNNTVEQLTEKHAKITTTSNSCTINVDNDAFVAMIEDAFATVEAAFAPVKTLLDASFGADVDLIGATAGVFPSVEGMQILGKDGLVSKTTAVNGKPAKTELTIDFSLNMPKPMGYPYESVDYVDLDFSVKLDANMSDFGSTKVGFPELTPENSVDYQLLHPKYDMDYYEEYPVPYVYFSTDNVFELNGKTYIPLRAAVNSAYDGQISIGCENGNISLESQWFTEFSKLTLRENSGVVLKDGKEITSDVVIEKDGVSYVSTQFMKDVFGWSEFSVNYNMLDNIYYVSFCTYLWGYEEYPMSYPYDYVGATSFEVPVVDGKFYVPLRCIIENAYDNKATIRYNDGVVTLESQWFPGFTKLTLAEGSAYAKKDEVEIAVDPVLCRDGVIYVSTELFEKEFGWTLITLTRTMEYGLYDIEFSTNSWQDEF